MFIISKVNMKTFLATLIVAFLVPCALFADGDSVSSDQTINNQTDNSNQNVIRDPRLPPLVPGEEVNVRGKKMKIISTSGPVPVSQPPEPWKQDDSSAQALLKNGGVIVDTRPATTATK